MSDQIRTFNTGATRNALEGKLSYMRALSPAVLRRYVEYLASHRKQADGNLREFDNWKKGIPQDAYCDSLMRHAIDAWARLLGLPSSDGTGIEDLLCAVIFNANGWLFEVLTAKSGNREVIGNDPVVAAKLMSKPRTCGECLLFGQPGVCITPNRAANAEPFFSLLTDSKTCFVEKPSGPTCGECYHYAPGGDCYSFHSTDKADPQCFVPCSVQRKV
jgi:hypothetical protein